MKRKIDTLRPRQLTSQNAWYYLPVTGEKHIWVGSRACACENQAVVVKIQARKLLRELLAAGVKP